MSWFSPRKDPGHSHRLNVLAVAVRPHVPRGDFVDEDNVAIFVIPELKLDVVEDQALLEELVCDDGIDFLGHFLEPCRTARRS